MSGVYTIYAYFNSEQIQGILNAIVMLMGSGGVDGDYLAIVRVAAILGLFIAVGYGFLRARGEDAAMYLIMMAIFYTTLFIPRVTVTIEEHGGSGGGAPVVVDNVPLGLAFFASTTSHIGYWLTEKTETFFSLPDTELRLSHHGLMGGARALRETQGAALPDPILAQDMINFMRDCINPELVVSPATVTALLTSTNIWADFSTLGLINPGRMVTLAGSSGAEQCDTAYATTLGSRIAPAATSEFARIARMLSPSATPANANVILTSMLPASESLIMTASASTTDAVRQRMMINMLNDTSASMAQILNDPAAAQNALGSAMAASNANSAYAVMAKLAQETLPLVRNAIELVVLGVFPIVLLLIIIAGSKGGTVLRSYVMTMLWVQLWAPLYAIVNYVGTLAGAKSMKAALAGVDGVSVVNAAQLMNTTISAEAIAGMLTISVPMIALALVKGGEVAMSGVTQGLTGPADRAANKVGEQVGQGNVAMGNTSWGNHNANNSSANHSNTAFGYVTPNRGDVQGEFGSWTARGSQAGTGNAIGNLKAEYGDMGVTGSHGSSVGAGHVAASGTQAGLTKGTETGLTQGTRGTYTQSQGAAAMAKVGQALERSIGGDWSFLSKSGAGGSLSTSDSAKVTTGNQHREDIGIKSNLGVGVGADTQFANPVDAANRQQQTTAAREALAGTPATEAKTGAAPAPSVPNTQGQPATQGAPAAVQNPGQTAATAPASAPGKPGAPAVPVTSPDPHQATSNKASEAAKRLGQAPSSSRYGVTGAIGFNNNTVEGKSFSGERGNTDEQRHQAEQNFDKATKAVRALQGRTSNSGERAAMDDFLGQMSKSTDAMYGTKTSSTLTSTASSSDSRNDGATASVSMNDNNTYGQEALRQSGGNPETALRSAVTNPGFQQSVANGAAPGIANSAVPEHGPATGMRGAPLDAPKSVEGQKTEGDAAVKSDRAGNEQKATSAGSAAMAKAAHQREAIGAPGTTAMPSITPAADTFSENKKGTEAGFANQQQRALVGAGINRATEAVFADRTGMLRLMDSSFLGGMTSRSEVPEDTKAAFRTLAQNDQPAAQRLMQMGNAGRATEDDIKFLNERAKVMENGKSQ